MSQREKANSIIQHLREQGYQAYLAGGCVRDFILGHKADDWDITTNATPDQIQKIFGENARYENKFGTVVVNAETENPRLKEIEITTYRVEEKYTDKRHPDVVKFSSRIEDDLARRDFTINAIAWDGKEFIDPFGGQKDIKNKIIRAVGDPQKRFNEDALRLMRAVRIAAQLDFKIEEKTTRALKKNARDIAVVSHERIRDEFVKIISSRNAKKGVEELSGFGLLKHIVPELEEGIDVTQNKHHIYTVWEHNLRALDWAAENDYNFETRLASLLHDVGKPRTKRGEGLNSTFYNHEVVGAQMTAKIMERLKFPNKIIEKVILLVRYHLFYYNVDEVTESSVRRLVKNVGPENVDDLLNVRMSDRKGSGVPKAEPYKLRHLRAIIEKVSLDPISVKMLKINGDNLIKLLGIEPGPKVGYILNILLDEVLDDPKKNTKEYLDEKAAALNDKSLDKLAEMYKDAQVKTREVAEEEFEEIKKKFRV